VEDGYYHGFHGRICVFHLPADSLCKFEERVARSFSYTALIEVCSVFWYSVELRSHVIGGT